MYNDYFELFGFEKSFDINEELLHENFIKLQQTFHPDKQVNKTQTEKNYALEYSSTLNKAYNILKDSKKRAEYLLYLQGIIVNSEDTIISADTEMLEEMLELSENANHKQLEVMKESCIDNFRKLYQSNDFINAAKEITKLQYLDKIFIL